MDLEGGVGAFQRHVVALDGDLLVVVAGDLDPERLLAQPLDAVVEGAVAVRVGDHAAMQVVLAEGGQHADHRHPAAVAAGGPPHPVERAVHLPAERGERPVGEGRRRRVQLQVEAVQLQGDVLVVGVGKHGVVLRQRPPALVDQEQLQLGAEGGGAGAEAGPLQQLPERLQAAFQPLGEAGEVGFLELVTVDVDAHAGPRSRSGLGTAARNLTDRFRPPARLAAKDWRVSPVAELTQRPGADKT